MTIISYVENSSLDRVILLMLLFLAGRWSYDSYGDEVFKMQLTLHIAKREINLKSNRWTGIEWQRFSK